LASLVIFVGLIVLIICAPIAVGSVYIVTYSAMELIIFSLFFLHIWTNDFSRLDAETARPASSGSRSCSSSATRSEPCAMSSSYLRRTLVLMSPLFLFLLFGLFQMVPLPFSIIKLLSPHTAALYTHLGLAPGLDDLALNTQNPTLLCFSLLPLSLSLSATSTAMFKWSAYAAGFFLAATVPSDMNNTRHWIKALSFAFFLIGFAEAVYGLYLYLNDSPHLLWFKRSFHDRSASGTYINRNHFAGLMNLCIPFSAAVLASTISFQSKARHWKHKIVHAVTSGQSIFLYALFFGSVLMVLALIFSISRMGQFSLMAATLFVLLLVATSRINRKVRRSRSLLLVFLVVLSVGFLWAVWKGLGPVEARWGNIAASYEDRARIWTSTLKMIKDFPVTGAGLGTYEWAYPPYKPHNYGARTVDHAHNDYLEMLSEVGLLGFIPWLTFFFLFFLFAVRAWSKRHNTFSRILGAGGLSTAFSMLVHSLADFNLQIPANAMLLFLAMGMTWRVVNTSEQHKNSAKC
jgi:O-antigen ligase